MDIRHNQKLGITAATDDVLRQVVRGKYSQTQILVQSKVTRDQAIMPTRALSFSARKGRGEVRGKTMTGIMLLIIFASWFWCATLWFHTFSPKAGSYQGSHSTSCPFTMNGAGIPTIKRRDDLSDLVQQEGFTTGLELGVQHGYFSNAMLSHWPKCVEYHLVDLWGPLKYYEDYANKDQKSQDKIYKGAMERLRPWKNKIHMCRNLTTVCSRHYENKYFHFIYVDARHDFKGVAADLEAYWPKLKVGGIIAGHDYITNDESGQNWTVNYDGTIDLTGTVV